MGVIQRISEYIVHMNLSNISAEGLEKGKQCILDGIGCGIYGQEFKATKILLQLLSEWSAKPAATIMGTGIKLPSEMAAKVNGVAVHVADFDDTSADFRGHPTCVVLPAAFSLCETRNRSGMDLLLAYTLGVELGGKLGKIMGWSHYEAGWHGTATIGTIASAIASAKVLGLNEKQTAHALAIAASGACGIRENFGTMVKSLHAGQASAAGVSAALLAEKGFEGSLSAFEGVSGFRRVYSGEHPIDDWADKLKDPSTLMRVMLKKYPSCTATHPALDALEELIKEHPFQSEDVEKITCFIPPLNLSVLIYPDPGNELEAKFSLPYCVSAFLVHGKLGLPQFEKKALNDPEIRNLMEKIAVVPDEALGTLSKKKEALAPTKIQIKLKTHLLSKSKLEASGGRSSPFSRMEIIEKFNVCAGDVFSQEKKDRIIDMVFSLESLQNITALAKALTP